MRARRAPLFAVITGVSLAAGACPPYIANPPFCEDGGEGEGEDGGDSPDCANEGEGEGE